MDWVHCTLLGLRAMMVFFHIRVNRKECLKVERKLKLTLDSFLVKRIAKLVYGELENNLKLQYLAPPWGVELVTPSMLEGSSHKFSQAKRPNHAYGLFMNNAC